MGLRNPAKLPELQLKFDEQIIGNHISKVPVSEANPLRPLYMDCAFRSQPLAPHSKLHSAVTALADLKCHCDVLRTEI